MEPIISFRDFGFQYRAQAEPTLRHINLDIYPGEKVLIAGASGGCQAEIGVAVSMASAALCSMMTDDPDTIHCAASLGGQVLMGLLCNPIEGYVQVPCIVRNMAAVPTAVTCANAALAGMDHIVPLDDVVALMLAVGEKIRPCDEAGTYILKKEEA